MLSDAVNEVPAPQFAVEVSLFSLRHFVRIDMCFRAISGHRHRQQLGRISFLSRKKLGIVLHDCDPRAQSAKCLRQFAAERTAADDA
jgi:hypothetical protein